MPDKQKNDTVWISVGMPAVFAIAGFVLAYLLVCVSFSKPTPYSELVLLNKKEVVERYLDIRRKDLINVVEKFKTSERYQHRKANVDSLKEALKSLNITERELYFLKTGNADTNANYYLNYFNVAASQLSKALLDSFPRNDLLRVPIQVSLIDSTSVLSDTLRITENVIYLEKKDYLSKVLFFREHNAFALWVVYSLILMMIWFLLLPILISRLLVNNEKLRSVQLPIKSLDLLKSMLVPLIVAIIFLVVFFEYLVDKYVVYDHYFLSSLNSRIRIFLIPGYLFSGLYFASFILLANKLSKLIKIETESLKPTIAETIKNLKFTFNLSFFCTAVNLSLAVVWMGILYSAVNSMEAPLYYTHLTGQPFIGHDLVYLTGLLHSGLLLIFYLPAKLQFDLEARQQKSDEENLKPLKGLGEVFISVLVTASPLLSGILQKLISNLLS